MIPPISRIFFTNERLTLSPKSITKIDIFFSEKEFTFSNSSLSLYFFRGVISVGLSLKEFIISSIATLFFSKPIMESIIFLLSILCVLVFCFEEFTTDRAFF